jgi:hypothetical protein
VASKANTQRDLSTYRCFESAAMLRMRAGRSDSELFDLKLHWRLAPTYRVESGRVVRVYPVVLKSMERM